ncbi:RibD family protein, partial [Rhizobiaceae sp. 2RAB30]
LGQGQIAITGPVARAQVHLMRMEADAILVGIGTALADDPQLTVRLPGLEGRSPARIVLDQSLRLLVSSGLVQTAHEVPVFVAAGPDAEAARRTAFESAGVKLLAAEVYDGRIALPELLEDLAARGMSSVLVEGGADTARAFLEDDLVDRIVLFRGPAVIGTNGVAAPIDHDHIPAGYELRREARFGEDHFAEWTRTI